MAPCEREAIARLPDAVLASHVFPRVAGGACAHVCKRWRALERARQRLHVTARPPRPARAAALPSAFPALLHLDWQEEEVGRFGFLDAVGLTAISGGCSLLRSMRLENCVSVDDNGISQIVLHCKQLTALRIENCPIVGKSGMEPVSKILSNRTLPPGTRPSPQNPRLPLSSRLTSSSSSSSSRSPLKILQIIRCPHFSDLALRHLLAAWGPSLRALHVAECGPLSDTWLSTIGSHCSTLEDLWLGQFSKKKNEEEEGLGPFGPHNGPHVGLRQQLAHFWAQFHAQAQAALLQGLQNPLPPPPPLPMLLLAHGNGRGRGRSFSNAGIESLGESCLGGNLRSLFLHPCGDVTGEGVAGLAKNCPNLQVLNLGGGGWEREGMQGAMQRLGGLCPRLTSLSLSASERPFPTLSAADVFTLTSATTSLKYLSFGRFSLRGEEREWAGAFQACGSSLQSIRLWELENVDNGLLTAVGTCCPNLRELWLDRSVKEEEESGVFRGVGEREEVVVNDESMATIAMGCRKFEALRLSGLKGLKDATLSLLISGSGNSLVVLDVGDCSCIGAESLVSIAENCTALQSLRLGKTGGSVGEGIAAILAKSENLILLFLSECSELSDLTLVAGIQQKRGRKLEKLGLTKCWNITAEGIEELVKLGENTPRVVELNEQKNMDLTARVYLSAAKNGCTICNVSKPKKGSVAADMVDPELRIAELLPLWRRVRESE